jgi:6-phosphogluconolactonase
MSRPRSDHFDFYLGTYTRATSRGIYSSRLNATDGSLSPAVWRASLVNPTWLTLHPDGRTLYANHEHKLPDGRAIGAVSSFSINPGDPSLSALNFETTAGTLCHTAVDQTGRVLVAVSYGGSQISSFPLFPDGRLGARRSLVVHSGPLGPHAARQKQPHPHSVTISPDNRFAFVADLGLDRVCAHALDLTDADLTPAPVPFVSLPPGTGPRHTKFSADGRHFYVIGELANTVTACSYASATGALSPFQTISTLPPDFLGESTAAEIRLHPGGGFLYASNRGHDSLAVFNISPDTGALTLVEIVACGGVQPRNFALTPDGAWLVCAHQGSDSVVSFQVDPTSGRLARVPGKITLSQPVCVLFARP